MVVSSVALFIALGGTGVAAVVVANREQRQASRRPAPELLPAVSASRLLARREVPERGADGRSRPPGSFHVQFDVLEGQDRPEPGHVRRDREHDGGSRWDRAVAGRHQGQHSYEQRCAGHQPGDAVESGRLRSGRQRRAARPRSPRTGRRPTSSTTTASTGPPATVPRHMTASRAIRGGSSGFRPCPASPAESPHDRCPPGGSGRAPAA